MANLDLQRKNYENQLNMLELKIHEAEKERDLAIAKQTTVGEVKNTPKIKEMESKLSRLRQELKQLQEQRKENEKLQRREEASTRQLQEAKNKVQDMKKQKVDLIKKMRDETKQFREKEMQVWSKMLFYDIILKHFSVQSRKEINLLKKNVRLKETNKAQQDRVINTQEELLQRKQREIQNLKQKIKSTKTSTATGGGRIRPASTNGYLNSSGNMRNRKFSTRQSYLKVCNKNVRRILA